MYLLKSFQVKVLEQQTENVPTDHFKIKSPQIIKKIQTII